MADIQQGDQYTLPFKIFLPDGSVVASSNVNGVRIQIDDQLKYYPSGGIIYDSTNEEWLFPLTETMTQALSSGKCHGQVGVKVGTEIIYSETFTIDIGASIIKEDW